MTSTIATPSRGQMIPDLSGSAPDGSRRSTRDFYMRRNLAVLFLPADAVADEWIAEAETVREEAFGEVGEILLITADNRESRGMPCIVDDSGVLAGKMGLALADLPALFVTDRFGTIFASTHGEHGDAALRPRDIPNWLNFVACRCT